jgi:hypothetical protein
MRSDLLEGCTAFGLMKKGRLMTKEETVIERVENGWVLKKPNEMGDGYEVHVFEDEDGPNGESEALSNLLWEAFNYYYRGKRSGGLVVSVEESHEKEEENELQRLDDDEYEWVSMSDDDDDEYDFEYDEFED